MKAGGGHLILLLGVLLFVCMLASLLILSQALQNPAQFDEFYTGLLIFNTLGLLALVILIGLNIRGLIRQARQRIAGARLTVRMVTLFAILSVAPILILYYFSLDFLYRGIDSWFDLRIEQALEDSLELSRLGLENRMKELLRQSEEMAEDIARTPDASIPLEVDRLRGRSGADELTVMTRQGIIIGYSSANPDNLVPEAPDDSVLFQVLQGNSYIGMDTIRNAGLSFRVVVNLPNYTFGVGPRILHALYPVTARVNELAQSVQSAFTEYEELSYLREQLKLSFILILTMVFLFSMFSAVWAAFYSARRLAAPIRDLAEGTRAVAEGDYHTRLPVSGSDELGFLVASFNDMTRKIASARDAARHSQDEAETQQKYLEAVLERLSSGVLVLDAANCLRTINISGGRILGLDLGKIIGHPFAQLCARYNHLEPLHKLIDAQSDQVEHVWERQVILFGASGRQVLICRGTSVVPAQEQAPVHIVVFDDITALLQGQRDAAWSEMARRLAHEIRNPLTPIQLAAERLRHKYLDSSPPDQAKTLGRLTNTIINQVETMKGMVSAFSDYARAPVMTPRAVDVNSLLEEVADLYNNMDTNANISLNLSRELAVISADPERLRQVFNNVITNALDAGRPQEPLSVLISTAQISQPTMDYVEIRIRDTGSGLNKDIMSAVFEPYVTTKQKGTGLGLAIVKKIIEEHGGLVMINNNENEPGACVIIRLPVNRSDNVPERMVAANRDAM
ncbi:MAG: ATP-binding protein [Gammaproteobacteria bacterium]|nr:ATP-binding protein [Gammaproteobacteria bacterium]